MSHMSFLQLSCYLSSMHYVYIVSYVGVGSKYASFINLLTSRG